MNKYVSQILTTMDSTEKAYLKVFHRLTHLPFYYFCDPDYKLKFDFYFIHNLRFDFDRVD